MSRLGDRLRARRRIIKPFEVQYFFAWRRSMAGRADAKGFCDLLQEAYGNASRHLGRGSMYYKAVIIDREQERIIAVLTRNAHSIEIKEPS